jgi:predicted nucleic acid-binding protein
LRFWDSSAVVALLGPTAESRGAIELRQADPAIVVWAWTPVECTSALCRRRREGVLSERGLIHARAHLDRLRRIWTEISDYETVRVRAERCLMVHPLRARDAGQLAAALVLSDRVGASIPVVTFDRRLAEAARREGLEVFGCEP